MSGLIPIYGDSGLDAAGMNGVRMAWGSAQEATALYHAMNLFPHSSMEEIGLLYLHPDGLPASWGFVAGDQMGSSPSAGVSSGSHTS